jgi:hypothetical protein
MSPQEIICAVNQTPHCQSIQAPTYLHRRLSHMPGPTTRPTDAQRSPPLDPKRVKIHKLAWLKGCLINKNTDVLNF